jgi:hypothetical protein
MSLISGSLQCTLSSYSCPYKFVLRNALGRCLVLFIFKLCKCCRGNLRKAVLKSLFLTKIFLSENL